MNLLEHRLLPSVFVILRNYEEIKSKTKKFLKIDKKISTIKVASMSRLKLIVPSRVALFWLDWPNLKKGLNILRIFSF